MQNENNAEFTMHNAELNEGGKLKFVGTGVPDCPSKPSPRTATLRTYFVTLTREKLYRCRNVKWEGSKSVGSYPLGALTEKGSP